MKGNVVDILLVEDNPNDAELTIRALKKNNLSDNLLHLKDGEEALEFLYSSSMNVMPKLILLDLKMPKVDGFEVLQKLKKDEQKKIIPIVILTSSKEERDLVRSYNLGVNAFVVKPVEFDQYMKAIADLSAFWMIINQMPGKHS